MSSRCDRLRGAVTASGVRPDRCSQFLEFKRIALRSWGLGFPAQRRTVSGLFIWCRWNVALLASGILVLDSRFVAAEGFEVSVPSQLVRFVRLFKQSESLQIISLSAVKTVCVSEFALFLTFRCFTVLTNRLQWVLMQRVKTFSEIKWNNPTPLSWRDIY